MPSGCQSKSMATGQATKDNTPLVVAVDRENTAVDCTVDIKCYMYGKWLSLSTAQAGKTVLPRIATIQQILEQTQSKPSLLFSNSVGSLIPKDPLFRLFRDHKSCWCAGHKTSPHTIWARSCENVSYDICQQQRWSSACASVQSDQHLCCSLLR